MDKETETYIDLGLPSGILWAGQNAILDGSDLMTLGSAARAFGASLPTWGDFQELITSCAHRYDPERAGTMFTGRNGSELFFPSDRMAAYVKEAENGNGGYIELQGFSRYWSGTPLDNRHTNFWCLIVQENLNACGFPYKREDMYHVRLVKRPAAR